MNNQNNRLQLEIKKSIILKWFFVCTHALAIIACTFNTLPIWLRTALVVLVSLHAWLMWRIYLHDHSRSKLLFSRSTGWEFENKTGIYAIQIMPSTIITTFVIILHFKIRSDEKQSILIVKDALVAEDFRELTVALKLYGLN